MSFIQLLKLPPELYEMYKMYLFLLFAFVVLFLFIRNSTQVLSFETFIVMDSSGLGALGIGSMHDIGWGSIGVTWT